MIIWYLMIYVYANFCKLDCLIIYLQFSHWGQMSNNQSSMHIHICNSPLYILTAFNVDHLKCACPNYHLEWSVLSPAKLQKISTDLLHKCRIQHLKAILLWIVWDWQQANAHWARVRLKKTCLKRGFMAKIKIISNSSYFSWLAAPPLCRPLTKLTSCWCVGVSGGGCEFPRVKTCLVCRKTGAVIRLPL